MLDFTHIVSQQQQTYTFYATGDWQTWAKPRNAKMIEIFCLGGGGGGASVFNSVSSNGGGGGASGGIVRGLIPAFLLPDNLYILVGKGGLGPSTISTAGGNGAISYVGLQPSILDQLLVCKSSSTVAGGGQTNTAAGTAPTIAGVTTFSFANLGLFTAIAGVAGSSGNGGTGAGTGQAALGTTLVTGGGGGGGRSASLFGTGGSITQATAILTTPVSGGITNGQNGANGYGTLQPFCGTGGAGGAGAISPGTGGAGGNGWYGCGGGGAGGGSLKGGDGGDGLVIITVIT
jgi:hypothetical protein